MALNDAGSNEPTGTWTDIPGATSCSTYTPSSGDVPKWHRASVTATNANGSTTANSRPFRLGGEVIGDEGCSGLRKVLANGNRLALSAGPNPPPCPVALGQGPRSPFFGLVVASPRRDTSRVVSPRPMKCFVAQRSGSVRATQRSHQVFSVLRAGIVSFA